MSLVGKMLGEALKCFCPKAGGQLFPVFLQLIKVFPVPLQLLAQGICDRWLMKQRACTKALAIIFNKKY